MKEKLKRHWQKLAVGVLTILLVFASLQIYDLSENIKNLKTYYSNQYNSLNENINEIYNNVDEKLKEQASLLSLVNCEYGEFNSETNKVSVTLKVIPKVITDDMELSTQIGENTVNFVRKGNEFIAECDVDIFAFGEDYPMLNIKAGNEIKTELLEAVEVYNLRYNYIPTVYSSCSISTGFSEGKLKLDGSYDVWLESPDGDSDIDFNKMYIIFELNGKEIQRTEVKDSLSENSYYGSVNQTLKFKKGDRLSLYALVEDIDGYTIKREITEYSLSDDEFVEELYSSEGGEVIAKNGKVLYQQ